MTNHQKNNLILLQGRLIVRLANLADKRISHEDEELVSIAVQIDYLMSFIDAITKEKKHV